MSMEIQSEERMQERERELGRQMAEADRACRVLEDEAFKKAVQEVRDDCYRVFCSSEPEDYEALYHSRMRVLVLEDVLTALVSVVQTGRLAEQDKIQINAQRRSRDAEPGEQTWQ